MSTEPSRSGLATLLRPWRAHHELDGLSDEECRDLIDRHWRRWPPKFWVIETVATLAALLAIPALILALRSRPGLLANPATDPVPAWAQLIGATALGAGLLALVVHRVLRHLLVRHTLRVIVRGAACPRCKQSLMGLPIYDDAHRPEDQSRKRVRCPECGKVIRLLKYGFSPQDLAPWEQRVLPPNFEVRRREQRPG